jgi:hypothetical protein
MPLNQSDRPPQRARSHAQMTAVGCGTVEINPPQHSIKQREKSGLANSGICQNDCTVSRERRTGLFPKGYPSGVRIRRALPLFPARTKSAIFHPLVRLTSQETAEGGYKSGTRFHLSRVTRLSRKVLIGLGCVTAQSLPYRTSLQGRRGTPLRTSVPAAQRRRRVAACSGFEMLRPLGIGNRPGLLRLPAPDAAV